LTWRRPRAGRDGGRLMGRGVVCRPKDGEIARVEGDGDWVIWGTGDAVEETVDMWLGFPEEDISP
jgi:hypothetical protein